MLILVFLIVVVGVWLAYGRKAAGKTILFTVGVIAIGLAIISAYFYADMNSSNNTTPINLGSETPTGGSAALGEKCVVEDKDLKICDLSFSYSYHNSAYRNIFVEGNTVACVDMKTSEVSRGNAGSFRATTDPTYCVTDWGYVYIDPTLYVSKHYGAITRENYNAPYKVSGTYDTCIWTYNDGNAAVPYLEVLSNIGPRSGFNAKAFCKSGNSRVDIYSFRE